MYIISAQKILRDGLRATLSDCLQSDEIDQNDTVWLTRGGDVVVTDNPADLKKPATNEGQVNEYLGD